MKKKKNFKTKTSGKREVFETGSVRDSQEGKLRYDLISPLALRRLAGVYTRGSKIYGDRNWEKGQTFTRTMASLKRHLQSYLLGERDEDHLAAMVWNGMAILHYEEAIELGLLDKGLSDLPDYTRKNKKKK